LGSRPSGVTSGIANSILVEQGEQAMGEMNDNYVFARRSVFEHLVSEISSDLKEERLQVPIGTGKTRRVVVLNDWDANGMPVNQVKDADIKTALAETPNTPAFRQQTQQQVAQIIQALGNNPQAAAILAPAYIESTSLPNRQEIADNLRKASGMPVPGDKNAQAQAEAQQQQQLQKQAQQADAMAQAALDEKVSASERNRAQARKSVADATLVEQRIQAGIAPAEVQETMARTSNLMAGQQPANEDELISQALEEAAA
jgi:hypothetical protein